VSDKTLRDWDNEATAFLKATGFLRPGKDVPSAMNPSDEYMEQRQQAWRIWSDGCNYAARALAASADAPEGPWKAVQQENSPQWWTVAEDGIRLSVAFREQQAIAVRDALNRLDAQQKGKG